LRQESQKYVRYVLDEQWEEFKKFPLSCLVISIDVPHTVFVDTTQSSFGENIPLSHDAFEILHASTRAIKPMMITIPDLDGNDEILCVLRKDLKKYTLITYMDVRS